FGTDAPPLNLARGLTAKVVRPLSFLLLPAETSRFASFFVVFVLPSEESAETQNRSPLHRKHRIFLGLFSAE
ncbi:MAG: hypothetical protein J6Y54_09715, partial [Lentisphaeria bacterium]|nr:hypothetical protein [Lentisphaeria bacterium]